MHIMIVTSKWCNLSFNANMLLKISPSTQIFMNNLCSLLRCYVVFPNYQWCTIWRDLPKLVQFLRFLISQQCVQGPTWIQQSCVCCEPNLKWELKIIQLSVFNIQTFQFLVFRHFNFQYSDISVFKISNFFQTFHEEISNFSFQHSIFTHPNSDISSFKISNSRCFTWRFQISVFSFKYSHILIKTF
jgi:hypothetical protein